MRSHCEVWAQVFRSWSKPDQWLCQLNYRLPTLHGFEHRATVKDFDSWDLALSYAIKKTHEMNRKVEL